MTWFRRLIESLGSFMSHIMGGGRLWGLLRLVLVLIWICFLTSWGRYIWNERGSQPASLFWWWGLRFWVLPLAALAGALLGGSLYVKRLHTLRRHRVAMQHLAANAFSLGIPVLSIKDGESEQLAGQANLVEAIGGPGKVNVRPGSAVIVETLQKPTRVLGAGLHILTRLEHLRSIINLADQHGMTEEVVAASKDGIELKVQRLQYRYRLLTGRQPRDYRRRTREDPFPFSHDAARKMAYMRTAFPNGQVTPWDGVVRFAVEGVVTDYLNSHQFDPSTTPLDPKSNPRAIMITDMNAKAIRERLRGTGTELLWFDIGNFEPNYPEVVSQRLETWGTKWSGLAAIEEAKGEAKRLSTQEIVRAEAQAEMLKSILEIFEDMDLKEDAQNNIHQLIVIRTAQILETMVEANRASLHRETIEQPHSITLRRFEHED